MDTGRRCEQLENTASCHTNLDYRDETSEHLHKNLEQDFPFW